jgi:uncharacterized protein (DUF427 family)
MKTPGPDHPITIEAAKNRWRAFFAGHVIADSKDALILQEASYRPVVYFPRDDVAMEYMSRTDHSTFCPYKGEAAYYTILMDGQFAENAVWTYEEPFPAMGAIAGRLAFYPDQVKVYELADEAVEPEAAEEPHVTSVDEAVLHTDSGTGAPQSTPWPPNVETPPLPRDGGLR